ncbi:splicing regulatory glutamine/lysine-rich protein 1-like [Belonocnema kinseyi]|uniref:splicing regulatory glutamine/lysine-rich protein 1-like n=1 Tax=Belonocnema kinseyi TaxID=2817044 RepID=UPI00143DD048|nr:splicing regulatory glutamine/lysine-rich protein 1-like [Belonocnema kinseyi]
MGSNNDEAMHRQIRKTGRGLKEFHRKVLCGRSKKQERNTLKKDEWAEWSQGYTERWWPLAWKLKKGNRERKKQDNGCLGVDKLKESKGKWKRRRLGKGEDRYKERKREETRGWWDEECKENKQRMKECVRKWRIGEMEEEQHNRRKREHERMLEREKQR